MHLKSGTVWDHAVLVFGTPEKAMRWLDTRLPELDGRTPNEIMNDDPDAVEALLDRIEDGVFW